MATILLVDDDSDFCSIACHLIEMLGHEAYTASSLEEARLSLSDSRFDHLLLDFMLPDGSGLHLVDYIRSHDIPIKITMISGHPAVRGALTELCDENIDHLTKPIDGDDLNRILNPAKVSPNRNSQARQNDQAMHFNHLIGESVAMQKLYEMIERVAHTSANVMLFGESGVGKEMVAKAIHHASGVTGTLVCTNCGALPKDLVGSELFGHEKGAFTGATGQRSGVFEQAQDGTLFLDEVTEMPMDMQPTLLRVLEMRNVVRVGGNKEIPVNCRVISATNRPMQEIGQQGVIREDIYFRLAVFPIQIPPLRDRMDDLPLLARSFLQQLNDEHQTDYKLTDEHLRRLMQYEWPGNVRELRHSIHRAYIMADRDSGEIQLPDSFASPFSAQKSPTQALMPGRTIEEVEKELIYATLEKVNDNKTHAAKMLGISTKTLYNRLHAYGDFSQ